MEIENLEIIIGTYEEFLLGFKVVQLETEEYILIQSFANHAHNASLRSVAAGTKFLATGSSDETIRLFDMNNRKEAGLLMHHHGNVNFLEFTPNGSHLVSGCENGSIAICRAGSWKLEKLWTSAHKGASVTSFSIHPSGKMMLSVGSDGVIRTWNLVKGRPAFTTHLCKPKEGRSITQVLWSPGGELYAVAIGTRVEVFSVAKAALTHTIEIGHKVTCIDFTCDDVLCVGTEDGEVRLHDVASGDKIGEAKAYDGRLRCLAPFDADWLVTASSEGHIKLWWRKDRSTLIEVCGTKIGARVTCMTAIASDPAENLLRLKAAATASKAPVTKKPPPQPSRAYIVIETAEDTENLARAAKQAKSKAVEVTVVSDDDSDDDEDEEEVEEEEAAEDDEVMDEDEDVDSVDDEEESEDEDDTDEGNTDESDGDSDASSDTEDLKVPMYESEPSSDSDEEPSNGKKRKRKTKIQKVSKFVDNVASKKAKLVLGKTNGAQRSVKKQRGKNPPTQTPTAAMKNSAQSKSPAVSKKNSTFSKSPAVKTASVSDKKSTPSKPPASPTPEKALISKKALVLSKPSPVAGNATRKTNKNSPISAGSHITGKATKKAAKRLSAVSSSGAWQTD